MDSRFGIPPWSGTWFGFFTVILLLVSPVSAAYNASVLPTSGSGPSYATACNNAWQSYLAASSSYVATRARAFTGTNTLGGSFTSWFTYYANASTLCDGVARLTQSPAVSLSTGVTSGFLPITGTNTYTYSMWYGDSGPAPKCSISPSDCDPLWLAYSSSMMRGNLSRVSGTVAVPTITAPPMTPHCMNRTAASRQSSMDAEMTACGPCTIFGNDVQLVFFPVPTTVSRDMCASTPKATLTHYGDDAIIEAVAGKSYSGKGKRAKNATTAIVGQQTFTSGTAYISIGTVWAADRCGVHQGSVRDAILAMPSSSVLSLRHSQNHFQYFWLTNTQTGYPVSYADFNTPIPWSAYNGQAICRGPYVGYPCSVIYENQFRPQLAIPPGIRQLHPDWSTCQMWYGGLYDPPLALQPQQSIERPSRPPWQSQYGSSLIFPSTTTRAGINEDIFTRPPVPGSTVASTAIETGVPPGYKPAAPGTTQVVTAIQQVSPTYISKDAPDKGEDPAIDGTTSSRMLPPFSLRPPVKSTSISDPVNDGTVDNGWGSGIASTSGPVKSTAAHHTILHSIGRFLYLITAIWLMP